MCSFSQCFLDTYYVPGAVLVAENRIRKSMATVLGCAVIIPQGKQTGRHFPQNVLSSGMVSSAILQEASLPLKVREAF